MNYYLREICGPWILSISTMLILLAITPRLATGDEPKERIEGVIPVQCRVVWTSDPARNAIISWSTAKAAKKYFVRYRMKDSEAKEVTVGAETGQYLGKQTELHYYHARLTDLKPAQAYEFQIFSDDKESSKLFFVTAPDSDRPFSILHGGDSRSNQAERRRVNLMISRIVTESYENEATDDDVIAFAHGGDYVANGADLNQWTAWMSDHTLTTGKDGRVLPIIPARGNHDKSELFNQVFGFPKKDRNYYAINLSPEVRWVTLNTEISTAGEQAKWLSRELKKSRPENRWMLAQYHRPAFPAVKAPGTALYSWVPIFEKYNMDLVCEADGHNIKRTVPIRGNVKDATGVVYIGEGGLGVGQRKPKSKRWYLQPPGMSDSASHVFILTFESEKLSGRCVRLDQSVADRFTLLPRQKKPK